MIEWVRNDLWLAGRRKAWLLFELCFMESMEQNKNCIYIYFTTEDRNTDNKHYYNNNYYKSTRCKNHDESNHPKRCFLSQPKDTNQMQRKKSTESNRPRHWGLKMKGKLQASRSSRFSTCMYTHHHFSLVSVGLIEICK